jgi:hypothetical protein
MKRLMSVVDFVVVLVECPRQSTDEMVRLIATEAESTGQIEKATQKPCNIVIWSIDIAKSGAVEICIHHQIDG